MLKISSRFFILCVGVFLLVSGVTAQTGVRAVVVNEHANVRVTPALGADVLGTVSAGHEFAIVTGRSGDNEWMRVDYLGGEGWVHIAPTIILSGDYFALPVADPRTIPFGGFGSPRAGETSATSGPFTAEVTNGVRMRAGPSQGYPTLANLSHRTIVPVTGRTQSNLWFQVIFDGILGWVYGEFLQLQGIGDVNILPVDGIVANAPPISEPTAEDYVSTLKLMRSRLDLAQPSLDQIRASWTDSALTGRAQCPMHPFRPSNMHIPTPLLAAFYPVLNPLQHEFNDAMTNLRRAIDLFIEVCNQPGTGNPVGTATVQGALGVVNLVDTQFASLRARLNELIPPDLVAGADQCLVSFDGQAEVLPLLQFGTIYLDEFTARDFTKGYCIDAASGQALSIQTLQLENSNIVHFMAISPLNNPTDFVALGRGTEDDILLIVSPITISETTRYLIILTDIGANTRSEPPQGEYAILISNITGVSTFPQLSIDPNSGLVTTASTLSSGGTGEEIVDETGETPVTCPSLAFSCNQLFTCEEAQSCLAAGNFSLDPDGDGIPCEENLCSGEF